MHGMNIKITISLSFLYKIRNVILDTFCYTEQIREFRFEVFHPEVSQHTITTIRQSLIQRLFYIHW